MILKKIIPLKFRNQVRSLKVNFLDNLYLFYYKRKIDSIKKRVISSSKLNVVFVLMDLTMWKYEGLYKEMHKEKRFDPLILIAPRINQNEEGIKKDTLKMINYFKLKEYNFLQGYNFKKKSWVNIKKKIHADIVFYTQPYNSVAVHKNYSLWSFKSSLFCYVPYFFPIISQKWAYNSLLQNIAWKLFYPTLSHINTAKKFANNKGVNVFVTGYPIFDEILNHNKIRKDPWIINDKSVKRIIWAPHHSIESDNSLQLSNFLHNYDLILDLAEKYKTKIQIAFKPHPFLISKLYNHIEWGKERADAYYKKWESKSNCQLETGEYVDLMITSDAMIHDSISFTVEYLYTKKPVFYVSKKNHVNNLCVFGNLAFDQHYNGFSDSQIEHFISEIVVNDKDPMKLNRSKFFNDFLVPPNNQSVANNILSEILIDLESNND